MSDKVYNQYGETVKAGAVVIRTIAGQPCILLVYRPEHKDWQLPKGHCEPGETLEQTAIREVLEETGYYIQLHEKLPEHTYIRRKGEAVVCHFFIATLVERTQEAQAEELPVWAPISRASILVNSHNLRQYLLTQIIPHLNANS